MPELIREFRLTKTKSPNGRTGASAPLPISALQEYKNGRVSVDFPATLRCAAPWQPLRKSLSEQEEPEQGNSKQPASKQKGQPPADSKQQESDLSALPAVHLTLSDLRKKERREKKELAILFAVDASRSQGAKHRLAYAKGTVLSLLEQAYVLRAKVGLITFGDSQSRLVLPLTKSVELARKNLISLPAAGNTPVGMGLRLSGKIFLAEKKKHPDIQPLLILLTDGKANFDELPGNPFELAMNEARTLKKEGIPSIIIDTERGFFNMGLAEKLADAMQGIYLKM